MSNVFTRIKDAIAADLNELLDQKEAKNPMAQINQYVRQCEQEAKKIRALLEKQYTIKQEFNKEYHQAKTMADKRKRQAELARQAGEEELYQHAADEQIFYQERAEKLDETRQKAVKDLENLEDKYVQMKHKLKDLYVRRMELTGRENVARAHKGMNQVMESELSSSKSSMKFQEMENYIERIERQVNTEYRHHTLDARLAELERKAE